MNRIVAIFADPANTPELVMLMMCIGLAIVFVLALARVGLVMAIGYLRARLAARRRRRYRRITHTPSSACERAGSVESFHRLMKASER